MALYKNKLKLVIRFSGLSFNRRVFFLDYLLQKKFELINNKFPDKVGLIHGALKRKKMKF